MRSSVFRSYHIGRTRVLRPPRLICDRILGHSPILFESRAHITSLHKNRPSHTYTSFHNPTLQQSSIYPVTFIVGIALGLVTGFFVESQSTPGEEKSAEAATTADISIPLTSPPDPSVPGMPDTIPPGRPGNLTAEQDARLREMWLAVLDIFGVHKEQTNGASASSSPALNPDSPDLSNKKRKSRLSWLGKKSGDKTDESEADDKYGQNKEFKQALATSSPESLRGAFWSMVKHDDPDALLLRFLRARKWDVHAAVVMLVSTMHWRSEEMHVDDKIMLHGEGGMLRASKTATGSEKKDAEDFMAILRKGLSFIHGTDAEGRPVTVVRARLNHPNEQTEKAVEQYTVYVIETARMLLRPPVDTATIVFDMTGFSMSNMDYTPVKFMIKCFEANYPESLGSVLVYKAPWIFQGIWKIIKGWLDPVVAAKVHFASDEAELSHYIPKSRIIKELGGEDDWSYKYVEPPAEGEDKAMEDTATRDRIENERKSLVENYEKETVAWAKGSAETQGRENTKIQLRDNYWTLDPYVRARSLVDRTGVLSRGGKLDFYPGKTRAAAADAQTEAHHHTHSADDVD